MGMDLLAKNGKTLRYNFSGWRGIAEISDVDLPRFNDGDLIEAEDCVKIGQAIEDSSEWYNKEYGGESYGENPAAAHAEWWKTSGGVEVW